MLVLGVALSLGLGAQVADDRAAERVSRFNGQAERSRLAIRSRVDSRTAVQEVLRDAVTANWPIDRREFHDIVASTDGADPFAGAQAVSFDRLVSADERGAYEQRVRENVSLDDAGYPDFEVSPATTEFDDLVVVEYLEPYEGNEAALGYDVGSDRRRRTAIDQARDLGELVATEPITLVQPPDNALGLLFISAVYDTSERLVSRPSRRRHFVGIVATVVRSDTLLGGAIGPRAGVEVEVYDQGPTEDAPIDRFGAEDLVYDTDDTRFVGADGTFSGLGQRLDIDVGGRRWSLMFRPSTNFASSGLQPWVAITTGVLLTLAVASVIAAVTGARRRAEALAEERTVDLRSILASAPDATVVVGADGTIALASDRLEGLLGYRPDEVVGQSVDVLVPEALRADHADHRAAYGRSPDGADDGCRTRTRRSPPRRHDRAGGDQPQPAAGPLARHGGGDPSRRVRPAVGVSGSCSGPTRCRLPS